MGLWSHGKTPDTASLSDHARAHKWAREREERAAKICKGCHYLKTVVFSLQDMKICTGVPAQMGNNSTRAIASILQEKRCVRAKEIAEKAEKKAKDAFYAKVKAKGLK